MQKAFEDIVERLERRKNSIRERIPLSFNEGQRMIYNYMLEECENSIKIVNQVAEEYKSTEHINCTTEEVCEWVEKSVDSIRLVREPHRLRLFHIEEDRQYCPYCGKKIKVVE